MKLRSRGSALWRSSGQTASVLPSRDQSHRRSGLRSAIRSLVSSAITGRCQTEAVTGGRSVVVWHADHDTGR